MAEDVDVRVLDRAQQAVGHLLAFLVERRVHRGDDEVERGEAVVGEVERAVRLDVALDAGEQPDAEPLGVDRANARGVLERAALVEAVGHRQRLAVIGDGDVLAAPPSRAASAIVRTSSLPSVSVLCMWRSPRRSARSIRRGSVRARGGVDLAAHLAQLRRHPVEAERRVDVFLALAGDAHVVGDPEQAVLVQLEAEADRAVAQRDVVRLRAGEVLQRGAAAVGGDEAQVGLEAALRAGRSISCRRGRGRARPSG